MSRASLRTIVLTLVACAVILGSVAGTNAQVRYKITDLGVLPGMASSRPIAINERGQVVGVCSSTSGDDLVCGLGVKLKPFLYDGSRMIALPILGDSPRSGDYLQATVSGISAFGQIIGSSSLFGGPVLSWRGAGVPTSPGLTTPVIGHTAISGAGVLAYVYPTEVGGREECHAAVLRDGKQTDLGEVPKQRGWASVAAVNDWGEVVVYANGHTYLYTPGKRIDMTALSGRAHVYARSMNNVGEVVGHVADKPGLPEMAFVYRSGKFVVLGALFGQSSTAFGINDHGQIVGGATVRRAKGQVMGQEYAFLSDGRWVVDLNTFTPKDSGWMLHQATGINNRGQICGVGVLKGETRGFLLTPVAQR
jgi:probable HAF family extracellular repeat protein